MNEIFNKDCREVIPELSKIKIDLVLTDPPYNIGFGAYDEYKDVMPDEQYIEMIKSLSFGPPVSISHYPEEMMKYIVPALGAPTKVLCWCYNSNINRMFRLVNIYGKKPDMSRVKQPYKNKNDKRILSQLEKREGADLYDWFSDIQLVKNVSEEKTIHPCPVPVALMKRLIILLTDKGDTVYDPFMGSGTTAIACLETERNYIGTEISPQYYEESLKRIEEWKNTAKNSKNFLF